MPEKPAKTYAGKIPLVSGDGSLSFYNVEYGESYRAMSTGAFTESRIKFFNPSRLLEKTLYQDLRVLDLCLGLGYNCAVAFDCLSEVNSPYIAHIVSVEKDHTLIPIIANLNILFPHKGYNILRNCLRRGNCGRFSLELYRRDALSFIYEVGGTFDAIFFDPFSRLKNPELWSAEVFGRLKALLADDGCLLTYAGGKKVREMMRTAGLRLFDTPPARNAFMPGTVAFRS
jgi:tRNA U34 5-methylaminomethyl-2-thiouridine-forming methyltransferase MnmC